jgi:hypothetical protein
MPTLKSITCCSEARNMPVLQFSPLGSTPGLTKHCYGGFIS